MIDKTQLKILIVDDIPENLQVIANTLEPEGYEMRFAEDGPSALATARTTAFDLILLDIMMPDMDGFEVCRRLKSDPSTSETPVIFITAKADTESVIKGFDAGGVDYVTKPFQVDELRARVGTHLKLRLREKELQELNSTKDKFISIVAHELKIPMGGISGFISLLSDQFEQLSIAEIRENLKLVKDATENFSDLVENLLNWSSIQVGLVSFRPSNFELRSVVNDVVRLYESDAKHKSIDWDIEVSPEQWAHGDIEMVETILRNLVSNTIKFGRESGRVRITAAEQGDEVLVTVEDNGYGISEENLEKLFRIDAEIKQIGTRGEIGTGMGLILCKECVERHKGRIWVESEVDRGTRVYFTLPKPV